MSVEQGTGLASLLSDLRVLTSLQGFTKTLSQEHLLRSVRLFSGVFLVGSQAFFFFFLLVFCWNSATVRTGSPRLKRFSEKYYRTWSLQQAVHELKRPKQAQR